MTVPTRGEIYSKLLEHIHMAEEHSASMGHLHNTEDGHGDKRIAKEFYKLSEGFRRLAIVVTHLAQGRLN